jgi:hypothetical protein
MSKQPFTRGFGDQLSHGRDKAEAKFRGGGPITPNTCVILYESKQPASQPHSSPRLLRASEGADLRLQCNAVAELVQRRRRLQTIDHRQPTGVSTGGEIRPSFHIS